MRFNRTLALLLLSTSFGLSGCEGPQAAQTSSLSSHVPSSNNLVASSNSSPPTPEVGKDGTIASMTLVTYPGQNPDICIYKMFYWSQAQKVEAFVTEPKNPGAYQYPVWVFCHGGMDYPLPSDTHDSYGVTLAQIADEQSSSWVGIFPEYSGYGDSQGSVKGLSSNAIDVENAITAARSLKNVSTSFLSVEGSSMGGAVALMVAASQQYRRKIYEVIAFSLFPGWEIAGRWDELHPNSNVLGAEHQRQVIDAGTAAYGKFSPNVIAYNDNSPDLAKIVAPVLLVQGTADDNVPWQMVQSLYDNMKKAGDSVTLDLVPGGNHGLTGQYQKVFDQDVKNWFPAVTGKN